MRTGAPTHRVRGAVDRHWAVDDLAGDRKVRAGLCCTRANEKDARNEAQGNEGIGERYVNKPSLCNLTVALGMEGCVLSFLRLLQVAYNYESLSRYGHLCIHTTALEGVGSKRRAREAYTSRRAGKSTPLELDYLYWCTYCLPQSQTSITHLPGDGDSLRRHTLQRGGHGRDSTIEHRGASRR